MCYMKKVIHKILSMLLAFVVLFSTMSFTIDMHFCGDTLVETAVFQKVKGCGMEMQNPSSEGCSITKKNCCNDEQLLIEGQEDLQLTFDKITIEHQIFIISFFSAYTSLFESSEREYRTYQKYKPPLVKRQIYKLDETYLI